MGKCHCPYGVMHSLCKRRKVISNRAFLMPAKDFLAGLSASCCNVIPKGGFDLGGATGVDVALDIS